MHSIVEGRREVCPHRHREQPPDLRTSEIRSSTMQWVVRTGQEVHGMRRRTECMAASQSALGGTTNAQTMMKGPRHPLNRSIGGMKCRQVPAMS
jgi:hypothetical protein